MFLKVHVLGLKRAKTFASTTPDLVIRAAGTDTVPHHSSLTRAVRSNHAEHLTLLLCACPLGMFDIVHNKDE